MHASALDTAAAVSLDAMAQLMARASLLVCNDRDEALDVLVSIGEH